MSEVSVERKNLIVPLCTNACPAGVDVPRYIRAVRDQKYDEAVGVLREKLPLPTVCADACFAPCEEACAYKQFGDPVAIRAIKRAAVDKGGDAWKTNKKVAEKTGKKIAMVGSGPAGLTAAYYLATKGHSVTIFDSFPKPGGMLRYGIPDYRVPEERLDKDIDVILELGVSFKGNTEIGKNLTLAKLKEEYDAVFLATGANGSVRIPLEGADKDGVLWGWDFLKDVGLKKEFSFDDNVVVVGGGNVAIDVALTAKRLGAGDVRIFCLEKREEMPAHEWEIARAEEERVLINNSWAPKKVLGESQATGLGLMKCASVFDKACNFNPTYDENVTDKVPARYIILAVGQAADLSYLKDTKGIESKGGLIKADSESTSTAEAGIFAGGDVVNGPDTIIGAIAEGRKAATAIDHYLGGDGDIDEALATPEEIVKLPEFKVEVKPRNDMDLLKFWERNSGFEQVELGLSDEQIRSETNRCLDCDARQFDVVLNTDYCKECGYCSEVCGVSTFVPADYFNAKGYRPNEVKTSNWCVGCFKCYFACPDFAIDIVETSA